MAASHFFFNLKFTNTLLHSTTLMVKLIHSTRNGDGLIAYMARVSNPDNQDNPESAKLIRYLIKHKHWSPFEMVNMCVEIITTRDIAQQIIRHRSFSFQEFSQRYAKTDRPDLFNLRYQDKSNRQNSIDGVPAHVQRKLQEKICNVYKDSYLLYEEMLEQGIAKECARKILPINTPTKLYMNGNARSWIHYIDLRSGNGTQEEHRKIAEDCRRLFRGCFPATATAVWEG